MPGIPLLKTFFTVVSAILALASPASAAPKPDLWERWQVSDEQSGETISHEAWSNILRSYVVTDHPSGINLFRYGEVSAEDREKIAAYIDMLAGLSPTGLSRREQLPYWINLYNALTVRLILDHFPVGSIREIDISPGLFTDGPWDAKLLEIEGEKVSLNDVEHRILRPIWKDNRIHYAVNCASMGCPDLQPEAFTADNAERLLERGARAYVNHARGVRFEKGKLRVSSIYAWFEEDFGGSKEGIIKHLLRYAEEPLRSRLADYRKGIADDYNWSLNIP